MPAPISCGARRRRAGAALDARPELYTNHPIQTRWTRDGQERIPAPDRGGDPAAAFQDPSLERCLGLGAAQSPSARRMDEAALPLCEPLPAMARHGLRELSG